MTDLWVRQISGDTEHACYRWYECESGEQGSSTLSVMADRWPEATLTLLIAGADCPSRRLAFRPEEKRHLTRLIPYELEADLAQEIAGLHIAQGSPMPGKHSQRQSHTADNAATDEIASEVVVSYIDRRELHSRITELETAGFDVRHCYAEPLLLPATASCWILRLSGNQVDICWGTGAAASVDLSMLGVLLDSVLHAPAAAGATPPQSLQLEALTSDELEAMKAQVLASVLVQSWQPEVVTMLLSGEWDGICHSRSDGRVDKVSPAIPDLRQGGFARPVRWQKIWRPMRLPLYAAGLAVLTFVSVTLLETQLNNQRFRSLQQDIESVYREIVPAGVLVDAEQQLRAQLGQLRGDSAGGSVLALLDRITPHLAQNSQVSINRLSYNGSSSATARSELQLSVEATSNTAILQFSEQLNNGGLQARAQNMTQSGNRQQASLIITETMP
ncbi:type II secretion system protein GspL [Pseudohongiella sp.]|uniref:GspL periplasmic domain-containing protein n=1 Tax=marine sediment metagenome TaxID=412755 RepID=A0A0F9VMP8_9ZZZZ|nr:type II secretion system protein GspL [Pseudohongiella sp.]HDZ10504.1 hypothetical protein [Pseudohongiella sp.]HEA63861.1 hypothetical protein [Pseudohongiella sp.]